MIKSFFRRKKTKKAKKKAKKKDKDLKTLLEKRNEWIRRWGLDDYRPFWDIQEMPKNIRNLIESGEFPTGATVVDIGCGSGYIAASLAEEGYKVLGFDFADTAIEKAKEKYAGLKGELTYYVADATKPMPFKDTFRVGIDRGTFHTLPKRNRRDYVESISPHIEKDGSLFIIYALRIAIRLKESSKDDAGMLLREHVQGLFGKYFEIKDFREIMMESHSNEDTPGFLINLRKKG